MKKKIILFTAVAGLATVMLTSGDNGAANGKKYDCTGAETGLGNVTGCSASGCHGASATPGITVAIELDSNGTTPTTHYKPGTTYTVKISGTNTTAHSLPTFGFQVSCIKGSVSAVTPVNAGTFATTGLPVGVRYTAAASTFYVCNFIEHGSPISATTGTGGTGTTYVESFQWTAPASGTGTVSFWGALNACNNDTHETGDYWNTTHVAISEWPTTSVATVASEVSVTAYPNPATTSLNIQMNNAEAGTYTLQAIDMSGKVVANEQVTVNGNNSTTTINTNNWASGNYYVILRKDGFSKTIPVVKK